MKPSKRQAYLAAMGWQRSDIEALLPRHVPPDAFEQAMCESGELRRIMMEVTRWFPGAKVVALRS